MAKNREEWLTELGKLVEPLFKTYRLDLRPYRISCGWPCRSGLAARHRRIGECHYPPPESPNPHQIFVSPLLDDPAEVSGTVVHELVHVISGPKAGHGPGFVRVAKSVGLTEGKPTSAAPGGKLADTLAALTGRLGPYPHSKIEPARKPGRGSEPTITVRCPECDYPISLPVSFLRAVGPPTCGCGTLTVGREKADG